MPLHIAQRLERTLVWTSDGLAATTVVKECIDRLLKHALLVSDDDLRSVELEKSLEAVVAVDDAPVQIIEIRRRETTTIERDQRSKVGRNHRHDFEHHPLGLVARLAEGLKNLKTLGELLALGLRGNLFELKAKLLGCGVHVELLEKLEDCSSAHACFECIVAKLVDCLVVALLRETLASFETGVPGVKDNVSLTI